MSIMIWKKNNASIHFMFLPCDYTDSACWTLYHIFYRRNCYFQGRIRNNRVTKRVRYACKKYKRYVCKELLQSFEYQQCVCVCAHLHTTFKHTFHFQHVSGYYIFWLNFISKWKIGGETTFLPLFVRPKAFQ